ncbi:FAD-dependent oxidoreductase [Radiobacillus kanasensis]|uniref:dihydrolipoyl dehydrogenase family protein n=1 Tax=Radiobacillus kanasensis TaxID=2844358 RepID=UPI001E5D57B6|nr:FAD-dependent oxidoreductase [Radiobacillus kanasensis]UFT98641.1 FAD-dependent oxidoreductase [Radiobacillus kanasensis]
MKGYDLIVVGGGAGGLTVAAGAASFGARVALVERKPSLGGDCLHNGCIPTKALMEDAKKIFEINKNAKKFGIQVSGQFDLSIAMKRVKAVINRIQESDSDSRFIDMGVDLYKGNGRFVTEHQIMIGSDIRIEGKRFVLATGTSPIVPDIPGVEHTSFFTNETIFEMEETPERLVVIGGGPTNLELGQSFARFGSKVTVMEQGATILQQEDRDISFALKNKLEQEISFCMGARVTEIAEVNKLKKVTYEQDGEVKETFAEEVLVGVGRKANSQDMGLEQIGVQVDKLGNIVVNDYLQTSKSHIFAIGDVNGQCRFTNTAGMEGKLVVQNAVFGLRQKIRYDNIPWAFYTDPEIFHIGLTKQEAVNKYGNSIRSYCVRASEVDRFITNDDTYGFIKILTNKKGMIIGAHAIGRNASDWMQELVFAKTKNHKLRDISTVLHPYPTRTEILQQAADLYWRRKLFNGTWTKWTKKFIRLLR